MHTINTVSIYNPKYADLIKQLVLKIYYSISKKKKSNWLVDLVFEIYVDSKFPVGEQRQHSGL